VEYGKQEQKCEDLHCKICDLENRSKCYLCLNDMVLHENKCIDTCPQGFYKNEKDNLCKGKVIYFMIRMYNKL
jgi:hypothetical protein